MQNSPKSFWYYFKITVTVISLIMGFQAVRIGMMFIGFRDMKKEMNNSEPVKKLPHPEIMRGLTLPEEVKNMDGSLIPSLYGSHQKPLLNRDEYARQLNGITENSRAKLESELLQRVNSMIKRLAEAAETPEVIDFKAPMHHLSEVRKTARYWYYAGRLSAAENKFTAALSCFTGTLILAHQMETDSAETGASLINRMVASAIRRIAATGLLETIPDLTLAAADLKRWLSMLMLIEAKIPDFVRVIRCEKLTIPSAFHAKNSPPNTGMAAAMRDGDLHKSYLDPAIDPIIEACNKPYSELMRVASEKGYELEEMQANLFSFSSLKYYFYPQGFMMKLLMTMALPNFKSAIQQDILTRQILRGAIIALAIKTYQREFGRMPESLEEMEKWLRIKFPLEIYSNKSFNFQSSGRKVLFSAGEDGKPSTDDDLVFVPLPQKP